MDQNTFQAMLENLHLGWTNYIESTTSTNDLALQWIQQGAPHLSVIATDHQTRGRGRAGRIWYTLPGTALALSVILRPEVDVQVIPRFTALGAIAVCNALIPLCFSKPRIKWPNDVLLQNKKTAGVLTEVVWNGNQLEAVVIGIGVNIEKGSIPPDVTLNFPATFVAANSMVPPDRFQILVEILSEIKTLYSEIDSNRFVETWEENLAFRGEKVTALLNTPETMDTNTNQDKGENQQISKVSGTLLGITADGLLTLELDDGNIRHFAANEIRIQSNN